MATFKDNLQRANKSGEGCINWEYYNIMKNNFGKKDSVAPKKITLFESSLTNFKKTSNDDQPKEATKISKLNDEENSDDELTSIMPKKKKKKISKKCYQKNSKKTVSPEISSKKNQKTSWKH